MEQLADLPLYTPDGRRITLGSVAPTIIRAPKAEDALRGQALDAEGIVRYAHRAIAGLTFRPVHELIRELEKITG